jgi:hypothetical protein
MANKSQSSSIRRLIGDTQRVTSEVGQLEKNIFSSRKMEKYIENFRKSLKTL